MKNWYQHTNSQVLSHFESDLGKGLTADQAEQALKKYGRNQFAEEKKESLAAAILHQLKDVATLILIFAAGLSLVLAIREGHGYLEPVVIAAIIIMNMVLAISQERKAEQALEALQNLNSPTCMVLREGNQTEIESVLLVPGDVILLSAGALVPADARLINAVSLQVEEAALTGESEPAEKDADITLDGKIPLGDQINMVFSGTLVTGGQAVAVVTATGMETEMGRIAGYLNDTQKLKTPLQERLDKIGRLISLVAVSSAVTLVMVGLYQGEDLWSIVLVAVSLAVAAVPETLNLIVTLSLTNGVQKMVRKNALIRRLPAVETLGNTSVICSDKTGTLTQNQMHIEKLWMNEEKVVSSDQILGEPYLDFLQQLAIASNAARTIGEDGSLQYIGSPIEQAILKLMDEKDQVGINVKRVGEVPFSSMRKMMTVIVEQAEGGYLVLTKGAFDRLPLKGGIPPRARKVHDKFAGNALRVIALAGKEISKLPEDLEQVEENLELVGLIGLIDPPRQEAKDAIVRAKNAGIRTVMITGDHAVTAGAIARQIGILGDGQQVITGTALDEMSDDMLIDNVTQYSVYARVSPENKIRIVEAWQEREAVVAMTGDGVNDAPALKAADVGIAMGITGTEVAKSAADMILTDDNFTTIVDAVEEGRNVYSNIRKVIYFLLVCNMSEIVGMLFAQIAGWGILVTPVLLLLINVMGDGVPGLYLAKETSDPQIMTRGPIDRKEGFFTGGLAKAIAQQTVAATLVMLVAFYLGKFIDVSATYPPSEVLGQTMAFLVLGWSSILHIFTVRSRKSIFRRTIKDNLPLVYSALGMVALFALMIAIPPFGRIFGLVPISGTHWGAAVILSVIPIIVAEIFKFFDNRSDRIEHKNRLVHHHSVED